MKFVKSITLIFALAFSAVQSTVGQEADLAKLINRLPAESNSLFLINGKALKNAPPAVMEKWKTSYSAANNASPLALPEGVEYAVMSTDFDIQHMAPLKQAVVLSLEQSVTAESIAKARSGVVDKIGDTELVWINDACVFVNSDKMVTVVSPLNRQSAARWLRSGKTNSALPSFLNEVAERFGKADSQIVFAVDLSNFFAESIVRRAVEQSGIFKEADFDQITKVLTSVRGVTIESELVYEACAISIDFGENIAALKPHAKEFVKKALTGAGAKLGNLDEWKLDVYDNRILLTGKLTPSIMQRVFSLNTLGGVAGKSGLSDDASVAEAPTAAPDDDTAKKEPYRPTAKDRLAASKRKRAIRANQKYFKQITDMLNDLAQGHSTNTLNDDALWISNYVRALTVSPSRDVDPILIDHGKFVARSLENIVGTLHMTGDRIVEQTMDNAVTAGGDVEVTAIPTRRYNFGGHVRHRYAPMFQRNLHVGSAEENFAIQDREIGQANSKASGQLGQVYEDHERVRQELSKKYGVDF